jgi:hypothetical protein
MSARSGPAVWERQRGTGDLHAEIGWKMYRPLHRSNLGSRSFFHFALFVFLIFGFGRNANSFFGDEIGFNGAPFVPVNHNQPQPSLKLLKIWGGENAANEEEMFNEPRDIRIGKDGCYYILDSGNKRIQVFDSGRRFVRSFGRAGQGPGEFSRPIELTITADDDLYVGDETANRILKLNKNGKYIGGFNLLNNAFYRFAVLSDGRLIMPNWSSSISSDALFFIYDESGRIVGGIGKIPKDDLELQFRMLKYNGFLATDSDMNCYVSYLWRPLIQKYSQEGKLLNEIKLEAPFKIPEISKATLIDKNIEQVSYGIEADPLGRIFVILLNRPKRGEERLIGGTLGVKGISRTYKHHLQSDKTDLYRLVIFDQAGKILGSWNMDTYCNKIRVSKDRVFIVDSFVSMCVYEYETGF